ncbi:dihydroorotate dehydrogenase electron transfer subunit [Paenibacillus oryzae]|uniref:Dihydroorotate dehydrogenase electron transfer subunit n=1 Tax=Paenibacillus oryzae TaxID=1844972 RepID=A0A1A5YF12_9BACL|nr:dihydroorotate dehydrogenase electron transfer subunit [Paenibacillus oryzae]OBR63980.1 dihydroorotate dehydrogenase electron transfer subunit [Paenibacillus oryzae]
MQAVVVNNEPLMEGIYRLTLEGRHGGKAGQFYMLRCWDSFPLLSRPISIHDLSEDSITFLYRVHGGGTELLSKLLPGNSLTLEGPYGNGFPSPQGRTALVGGGMGIAPLLLAAKEMPEADVYLGYSGEAFAESSFRSIRSSGGLTIISGGTILDSLEPHRYDTIMTCGPVPMMEELARRCAGSGASLYVSVEKRMACGIGACNGCAVETPSGIKKACVDGPVFPVEEVNFHDLALL